MRLLDSPSALSSAVSNWLGALYAQVSKCSKYSNLIFVKSKFQFLCGHLKDTLVQIWNFHYILGPYKNNTLRKFHS